MSLPRRCLSLLAGLALLLGAACATVPKPLAGGPFAQVGRAKALTEAARGLRVRWGGTIVKTTPRQGETCIEIVSHPLDRAGRPERTDATAGRFVACLPGFLDPAVYTMGREVTVVGRIEAPVEGKIGDHPYRFPKVAAETVYLWPREEPYYGPWWPDPFWYPYYFPYPPYWPYGPYYGPWWP
ncbi:MAG: hypothetical protein D6739_08590 [Nitrospirae bacterium]|nr:MAG: hypothetical protein D6739_08590 [Nitrospirota bacterium]